jgi:hypothetical protein
MPTVWWSRVLLLTGLSCALAAVVSGADDKEKDKGKSPKEQPKSVLELARLAEEGEDIVKPAAGMKSQYKQLKDIMESYKSRTRKGIGFGPKSPDDGIETKIIALGKQAPTAAALKKERAELIRLAHVNIAVSELARHFVPEPKDGKGKKDWQKHCDDLKKTSQDLVKAVKASDTKAVQKAAAGIQGTCNRCHVDFRD